MAWSRAFQKCIIYLFLDKFFFANIFTIKLDFALKNSFFANLQIFCADSKSRAQELSNDVSFVIFGHKTWDLEGGLMHISNLRVNPCGGLNTKKK